MAAQENSVAISTLPVCRAALHDYTPSGRLAAQGLHLALCSQTWAGREALRRLLSRLFAQIAAFLVFRGREVPRDGTLARCLEEAPPGSLVLISKSVQANEPVRLSKSLRLHGVGRASRPRISAQLVLRRDNGGAEAVSAAASSGPTLQRTTTVDAAFHGEEDGAEAGSDPLPWVKVRLHNLHLVGGGAACLEVGSRVLAQASRCLLEEDLASSALCVGAVVGPYGRLEAVDCAFKDFQSHGILIQGGIVKLARCRISGGTVGMALKRGGIHVGRLFLRDCFLVDSREIGLQLPYADELQADAPACCNLINTCIAKSWYPVAQQTSSTDPDGWVQRREDMVGLAFDARCRFEELADDGEQDWRDFENKSLGRSVYSFVTDLSDMYHEDLRQKEIKSRKDQWD